ncbi:MAG: hypothetical protein ABL883_08410 [Terricaulis sp.]
MAKPPKPQSKAARNERRKALAATLNGISVATLVAAFLQPIATGRPPDAAAMAAAFAAFIVFQAALHYILKKLED